MRKKLIAGGLVLAVALAVFVLVWFQPQKLFYDQAVNETLPSPVASPAVSSAPASPAQTPPAADVVLRRGSFISHEHETRGTAEIVRLADGRRVLALRDLDTSNGPDLYVWLSDRPAAFTELTKTKYLDLGRLKGNKGSQVYEIPAGADLGQVASVTIWCKRFSASFGAADLTQA
ncbi:DM13 domain-containing protein [Longispora albida]|uniref:DM13 domain-containing protein n=1 Tax=Longispora albida TaxID=203523 RepID=UPI0003665960|nr:DM13 domain-containing protein [Longispora albida]